MRTPYIDLAGVAHLCATNVRAHCAHMCIAQTSQFEESKEFFTFAILSVYFSGKCGGPNSSVSSVSSVCALHIVQFFAHCVGAQILQTK